MFHREEEEAEPKKSLTQSIQFKPALRLLATSNKFTQSQLVRVPWDSSVNLMRTLPDLSIREKRGVNDCYVADHTSPSLASNWSESDTIHKHTLLAKSAVICFMFILSLSKSKLKAPHDRTPSS